MKNTRLKYSTVALAIASTLSTPLVYAETKAAGADEIEVIEVTGIRASNKKSLNQKRFANSIVDAITAEDVGKFPDSDVGETLGRISGVAVSRQFGQGQQVSIRGASSQLTRTLLNGHTIASTGWYDQQAIDRSFNYTLLPPELVGGIEVYKSSQADIAEGGIGGTVIVNTRKPFELDSGTVFASLKGDYGTVSEATDPQISGLASWKTEDEKFGALVALSQAETEYQRNGIESLVGWGDIVPTTFQQERERTALNAALQFAPSDELVFTLNVMSLDFEANNANTSLFVMFPDDKDAACEQTNQSGTCVFYRRPGTGANPGWAQTWARDAEMSSDTVDLEFEYEGDGFQLEGRLGSTESEGGTGLTANYGFWLGTAADYAGTYDMTGDVIQIDVANKSFDASDFGGQLSSATWALKKQPNSDKEDYAQLDLTLPFELGAITSLKTGVRWADHEVMQETFSVNLAADPTPRDASYFYSGTVSSGAGYTLPSPNLGTMLADSSSAITNFDNTSIVYRSGFGEVSEENLAVYLMANYEGDNYRGNFGVRYISTDASSTYFALDANGNFDTTTSTDKADYSEVLPSANLAYDLSDDVILRASFAQVISRPNYSDMFATPSLDGYNDGTPGNEVLSRGNIGLKPFKATQADLGLEYYFSADGLLGATLFIKDISAFTTTSQLQNQQIGIVDPNSGADNWTVSTKSTASGGSIYGIELQAQDAFDNGFGYVANYTYANGDAKAEHYPDLVAVFSDSSEHTVNLVGYYEMDNFSARLAYNWRSEYMIRELPGFYGNREHQDYGSLDASFTYSVNDNLDLTFEAVNITEEDSIQIGVAGADAEVKPELKHGYPAWSFEGEARYKVGVSVRF